MPASGSLAWGDTANIDHWSLIKFVAIKETDLLKIQFYFDSYIICQGSVTIYHVSPWSKSLHWFFEGIWTWRKYELGTLIMVAMNLAWTSLALISSRFVFRLKPNTSFAWWSHHWSKMLIMITISSPAHVWKNSSWSSCPREVVWELFDLDGQVAHGLITYRHVPSIGLLDTKLRSSF